MGCCNLGKNASLEYSFDGGLTYSKLGRVQTISYSMSSDSIDATTADDNTRSLCPGLLDVSLTCDGLVCPGDAGQSAIDEAVSPVSGNAKIWVKLNHGDKLKTGTKVWIGEWFIDSKDSSFQFDDNINFSLSGNLSNITETFV